MVGVMLKTLLSAALLFAAGTADAAERRFTVSGFEKVQVEGPFQVTVATGKGSGAVATGSTQALDRVSVAVEGRTLRIRPNRSAWGTPPKPGEGAVSIALTTHELSAVTVAGSGSLRVDRVKAMRFDAALSGSGRLAIGSVEADRLNVQLLGSGGISLAGKAKLFKAAVSGQGALDAAKLATDDAEVSADTSGAIALGVRRSAKIASSGAGDVTIAGSPACTVTGLGAGRVSCGT